MGDLIEFLYDINRMITSTEGGKLFRNLVLTAISAEIVALAYVKFSNTISDKRNFAKNFFLLSVTTMLVITFIRGSLALSLGLVGALSIIRFRTAIKEPEELAYLFLVVGVGLGFGSGYVLLTVIGLALILSILAIKWMMAKRSDDQNLFINFATPKNGEFNTEDLMKLLNEYTATLKLKRFDESEERFEATFNATFPNMRNLNNCKSSIISKFPNCNLTYVETENY